MKNKKIKAVLIIVILIYVSSYYIARSGYYEWQEHEKMVLTNEKIKEFEQDVKNNKDIDVKDYLNSKDVNYSNKASDLIYNFSLDGNKTAKKFLKALFKKINKLVDD